MKVYSVFCCFVKVEGRVGVVMEGHQRLELPIETEVLLKPVVRLL
jgi:hypothetical protein